MDRRLLMLAMGGAALAGKPTQAQAQAQSPVETFDTQGMIQGQSYQGMVAVQQTGDTFALLWNTGGEEIRGVGILRENVLYTGFLGPNNIAGIAFYHARGNGVWEGEWALVGGTAVGRERWRVRGK
jgi:hypothetical protein